jgi:hypothetical protein
MSFMFSFKSHDLGETRVFADFKLYSFLQVFVNFIYYTLLNLYIYSEKRLSHAGNRSR